MLKFVCLALSVIVLEVSGHGMMMDPINRSSLWRVDPEAPPNYTDNQNYCGGLTVQHQQNGGKCGVCGDDYTDPHPQENENTGTYGNGKVVATYSSGEIIQIYIKLNANHKGKFTYHLCVLHDENAPESKEECFQQLQFEDGSNEFTVADEVFDIYNRVRLPAGLTCARCVLRWHYTAGNNWGTCEDGSEGPGCGPQETFRSCSDITIV